MNSRFKHPSHDVASVKAKVLAAASAILAEKGVEDLNLRAIAESAGIGISSMYHYFANKEDLLLSLAVMGFEDLRRDIVRFRADPQSLTPVGAGARAFFGFAETRPALFSVMFAERRLARHEGLREVEQRTMLEFQASVETDARFPPAHQANVAMALWALGRGIAATISSQPDGQLPEQMAEKLWAGVSYLINHPD